MNCTFVAIGLVLAMFVPTLISLLIFKKSKNRRVAVLVQVAAFMLLMFGNVAGGVVFAEPDSKGQEITVKTTTTNAPQEVSAEKKSVESTVVPTAATADGTAAATTTTKSPINLKHIAAAVAIIAGCFGAGWALSTAIPAALGAMSENPDLFGKSLILVALAEGVTVFGFLIAILILVLN